MRILILGGTMFLSRTLAKLAVKRGHRVTALARGTHPTPAGVALYTANRDDGEAAYQELLQDPTAHWDAAIDVSRVPTQVSAAIAALQDRVSHWTFVSTVSVYADHAVPGGDESKELLPEWVEGQDLLEHYGEAKVACETILRSALAGEVLIARPGLICGPGDPSDRYGYWPARFARDNEPVLVPDLPGALTQVIDSRDLASWLLDSLESGLTGIFDAVGPKVPFQTLLGAAVELTGHRGEIALAAPDWLLDQGVNYWAGPDSLPLWLPTDAQGMMQRDGAAARQAGLRLRPFDETLEAVLADERSRGLDRERRAGLSAGRETALIEALKR
ncbi:nucleoside-diphosphate-sugar epimerase [Psychromicrobium silvestre]|uniref:Nucleoside-diphosphate-sugar epimerase n=1 Tax=Psychromicrobium silvestre TaxID=1645614 RepID=A0A7Y9S4R3_9MICC|nr:NAD-dependent epimerase/dehydratase family protein [Psychromicrobium silvestre]NYE94534.1 nucleoside-diphosphate-sugar epimerase [Psychromicrobium silvestre]